MYIFERARKLGFEDGIKDKKYDINNDCKRNIRKIDKDKIVSDMYDLGYFEGYNYYKYNRKKRK